MGAGRARRGAHGRLTRGDRRRLMVRTIPSYSIARVLAASVAMAAVISGAALAEDAGRPYPDHAVRIVVPTAPAGAIDGVARAVGAKLAERWRQPVVIDNKPGANIVIVTDLAT